MTMKRNLFSYALGRAKALVGSCLQGLAVWVMVPALVLSSCSYRQFGAVATGSSLGGMLGSSIGGLMGGWRGSDKGTIAGMVIGGVAGAVVTAPRDNTREHVERVPEERQSSTRVDVHFDSYNSPQYRSSYAAHADLTNLVVGDIHFLDGNNNQRLDADEEAYIVFEIYNRGSKTLYNVTPYITCDSKRVVLSSPATIQSLGSGQGIRYKAMVKAIRKPKKGPLNFTISFGKGNQQVVAKTFSI